jgi:hypothetical protein
VHSDAQVVPINSGWRSAYIVTSPGQQFWVKNPLGQNQDQIGETICRSAIYDTGGYECGAETSYNLTWQYSAFPWFSSAGAGNGTKLMYQRQWSLPGVRGDSGAPMFIWASPTSVTAVGQFVGNPSPSFGNGGSWSTIYDITTNLGVGLVTCGSC